MKNSITKVLLVTEYIDPNQNSTGYYWSQINKRLISDGCKIEVITPIRLKKYESAQAKPSLIWKMLKQVLVTVELARNIAKKSNDKSIVFTGTNPLLLTAFMPLLKRIKKFNWVMLAHDVFPENLVASKKISGQSATYKLLARYYSRAYKAADKIICIGRDMRKILVQKVENDNKVHYASNWVDVNDTSPKLKSELSFFKSPNWDNKIVFQFFGNIGPLQGVENILAAICQIKSKNVGFIFIGGGAYVSKVEQFIVDNPEIQMAYLGPMPMADKNIGLSMCDIALVSLESGMLGLGVPSKTYFSLAANKPILAIVDPDSEVGMIIREHPIGWQCAPDSPVRLAELVDQICTDPSGIKRKKPRDIYLQHFTGDDSLNKISLIIHEQCNLINQSNLK